MADETAKTGKTNPKPKRASKGWRAHVRQVKQTARKAGIPHRPPARS